MKVVDAIGAQLDWLVAKCEGYDTAFTSAGDVIILREGVTDYFDPHRNWGWGGPIIDRERITIRQWTDMPIIHAYMPHDGAPWGAGSTPLIAAMRCFCRSKLGDVVDIPEAQKLTHYRLKCPPTTKVESSATSKRKPTPKT